MNTFRALCEELTNELQGYKIAHPMHCRALLNRARAELAKPEPAELTDEEVKEEWYRLPGESLQDVVAFARAAIAADRARCTPTICYHACINR